MYDPMVTFIQHEKSCMVSQSNAEIACLSRESKSQKYFFSEKLLKNYDIFNKSLVKKGSKLNYGYFWNEIW